jgi:hypothetical protein
MLLAFPFLPGKGRECPIEMPADWIVTSTPSGDDPDQPGVWKYLSPKEEGSFAQAQLMIQEVLIPPGLTLNGFVDLMQKKMRRLDLEIAVKTGRREGSITFESIEPYTRIEEGQAVAFRTLQTIGGGYMAGSSQKLRETEMLSLIQVIQWNKPGFGLSIQYTGERNSFIAFEQDVLDGLADLTQVL